MAYTVDGCCSFLVIKFIVLIEPYGLKLKHFVVDVKLAVGIQPTTPGFGAQPQQNPSPHTTAQLLPILVNCRRCT